MKESVAIVTGASQGIGRATAIRLAKDFSGVVLAARDGKALEETAGGVKANGASPLTAELDLRSRESAETLVKQTLDRFGRIDALVNIAGAVPQIDLFEMTDEQWEDGMELKFHGARRLTILAWEALKASRGSVVLMSGSAALDPKPAFAAVAAINAAIIVVTSISAGLILKFVSRGAAGSGIPQVMVAYWRDFGFIPGKVVVAKFLAGVLSIGGGCSLGREGPTVHLAGALTSTIAGWFGVAKQERRPALLCGAAAGLAGAFNTPLSAIAFVLEQISEDLNHRGFLSQVLIASATATFVAHALLGENPAFAIPAVSHISAIPYLLIIPLAGLAALAGVGFQKGTLAWRDRLKRVHRVPLFLRPAVGALINWVLGIAVFFGIAKIGVFGLGYGDLETMLGGGVTASQATFLLIAKLAASMAVYAWGGVGGIFSPTLFFGAATGLVFTDLCGLVLHIEPSDRIALSVAGMSACFGAVVRAPITSILIVFEMTHQFSFVPLLMIGTIASQAVSRSFCRTDFYNGIIEQDGIELDRSIDSPAVASPQSRVTSTPD